MRGIYILITILLSILLAFFLKKIVVYIWYASVVCLLATAPYVGYKYGLKNALIMCKLDNFIFSSIKYKIFYITLFAILSPIAVCPFACYVLIYWFSIVYTLISILFLKNDEYLKPVYPDSNERNYVLKHLVLAPGNRGYFIVYRLIEQTSAPQSKLVKLFLMSFPRVANVSAIYLEVVTFVTDNVVEVLTENKFKNKYFFIKPVIFVQKLYTKCCIKLQTNFDETAGATETCKIYKKFKINGLENRLINFVSHHLIMQPKKAEHTHKMWG